MRKYWVLFFFPLGWMSCAESSNPGKEPSSDADAKLEAVEVTDEQGNIVHYTRRATDFAKQGEYTRRSADGKLIEQAYFMDDSLSGKRILFSEKGDTQVVETYSHGYFEGPYRGYYENGKIEIVGQYQANTMEGVWKRYYDTGELMEEVTFQDNAENGPFKEYYKNGKLKAEGSYKDGDNEHGLLKLYDETGELVKTMNCNQGICRTVWKKEGTE